MAQIETNARFDFIRYANCWEDADILNEALAIQPGQKCLSICSAGDNSLSLLVNQPELVLAIDLNPSQLACLDIRIAAFKTLDYEELLGFFGVHHNDNRLKTFERLKSSLSSESRGFWEDHQQTIENGIIYGGKFENYFNLFRNYVLPLMHKKKTVDALVSQKSIDDQRAFYQNKWNHIRWRLLFRLFFGRFMMGRLGRDPEFFKYVKDDVGLNILKRTQHAFTEIPTYTNPYLNFIMTGHFTPHALPHYLRPDHFNMIKTNIHHIKPFQGNLKSCALKNIQFDAFNLSDIFEYMNMSEFRDELSGIISMASKDARIAYWNMLSDRIIPDDFPITIQSHLSDNLFIKDKAWFYKRFIIGLVHQ